jgi:putative CocE/NonD family hydrolase
MPDTDSANVQVRCDVRVPLRDGVSLSAVLYTRVEGQARSPAILAITPYTNDGWHMFGTYFAARGLPFVMVEARGRGNSGGRFTPGAQAGLDGYDVVEWLARQPYCDGKVGMYGASDLGYVQWVTAREFPPHLCTIVPAAAPFHGIDFPFRNNIFYPYAVQWLTLTSGHTNQGRLCTDDAFWSALYRRWHESGRPFRELDTMVGNPLPLFQEWLAHPEPDGYWDAQNPTDEQYGRMAMPVLTITGSYDDDQPGALEHYRRHDRNASAELREQRWLVIGPWNHGGTQWPVGEFGRLRVGPESLIDIRKLHYEWYLWTLGGGPRPAFLQKRVAYYVTGAERWRYADTLDEITASHQTYFLDSAGTANDLFKSGTLGTAAGVGSPDRYTYDPADTQAAEIEAEVQVSPTSLVDQSTAVALRGRLLVYHTSPFERDVEVSGFFRLTAWIAIDCPDTDFYVSIHDIDLNGRAVRLSTDALRARYRGGLRAPALIGTREPLRYEFNRFTFASRLIKRGHALRLTVAPTGRLIEGLFAQRNFNAGGIVAQESIEDARAVTVRLFHDGAHPSALHVPTGRPEG